MDFAIEGEGIGRVIFELFHDIVPKTVDKLSLSLPRSVTVHRYLRSVVLLAEHSADPCSRGVSTASERYVPDVRE